MSTPTSGPLTGAVQQLVDASGEASVALSILASELRVAFKASEIPEEMRKTLTRQTETMRLEARMLAQQRDPDTALSAVQNVINTASAVSEVSVKFPIIAQVFSENVEALARPYLKFISDHGATVITANTSLQLVLKNPMISALVLALQTYQAGGLTLSETIIDAPANVAYAVELLQQLTPTLLMLILLMSVAAVYVSAQFSPPAQETQDASQMAKMAADFMEASKKSVEAAGDFVAFLKLGAANEPRLISQAERIAIAERKLREKQNPAAPLALAREVEPLTTSADPTTAAAALKVVAPFLSFVETYGMALSKGAVEIAAVVQNPKLSGLVLGMTAFVSGGVRDETLIKNPVNAALTAKLLSSLNPALLLMSSFVAMAALYGPELHISEHHRDKHTKS